MVKEKYLIPPATPEIPYNFTTSLKKLVLRGQEGQPIKINAQIFKHRIKNGFFVEAGAYDGESFSNSLFYEIKQNWNGLLVEANPDAFEEMTLKVQFSEISFIF